MKEVHFTIRMSQKQFDACEKYKRHLNRLLGLNVSVSDVIRMAINWLV